MLVRVDICHDICVDSRQTSNTCAATHITSNLYNPKHTTIQKCYNTIASFANAIWLMLGTATQLCHVFPLALSAWYTYLPGRCAVSHVCAVCPTRGSIAGLILADPDQK